MTKKWEASKVCAQVVDIQVPVAANAKWEQWVLRTSDRHHDNLHCDQAMELRHLKEARERNAIIVDSGDLFCAMQGKWDRRSDQDAVREEHRGNNYLDKLVSTAADFYAPYADLFAMMSPGNHETSIRKHHETDLTDRLIERLNACGGNIQKGSYSGFIRWRFFTGDKDKRHDRYTKGFSRTVVEKYHHGYGGGGPVTRGVIQNNREGSNYVADIYSMGHTHDANIDYRRVKGLSKCGRILTTDRLHVRIPSYKDEHTTGDGWANERGGAPKMQGAVWYRFFFSPQDHLIKVEAVFAR